MNSRVQRRAEVKQAAGMSRDVALAARTAAQTGDLEAAHAAIAAYFPISTASYQMTVDLLHDVHEAMDIENEAISIIHEAIAAVTAATLPHGQQAAVLPGGQNQHGHAILPPP